MTLDPNISSVLDQFASSSVRPTGHPGVYEIKERWATLRSMEITTHRRQLIEKLLERFPAGFIWLKDLNAEAKTTLGTVVRTSGDAGFWSLSNVTSLGKLLDELHEGGWAMFFFAKEPEESPSVPTLLPTKPEEVISLLHASGAKAVIISWYDDTEWLVAFNQNMLA